MTIGEYIKQYLDNNKMSMREFSRRAGVSTAYISMLINGRADGSIPTPTIDTYRAAAKAMCMGIDELVRSVEDIAIAPQRELTEREKLSALVDGLSDEQVHHWFSLLSELTPKKELYK